IGAYGLLSLYYNFWSALPALSLVSLVSAAFCPLAFQLSLPCLHSQSRIMRNCNLVPSFLFALAGNNTANSLYIPAMLALNPFGKRGTVFLIVLLLVWVEGQQIERTYGVL